MKEYQCSCDECKKMCQRTPCMGTPKEIEAIMDAGYIYKLTRSDVNDPALDFTVIMPAMSQVEQRSGKCPFYKNGLCELHKAGLKPIEGRVAMHGKHNPRLLYHHLARAWNGKHGRVVIQRWEDWATETAAGSEK